MIRQIILPKTLQSQIAGEALTARPRECCGLIEGTRRFDAVIATGAHATRNIARQKDRFEIDPADHFRLLRTAREAGREIVGCYHSHPNGHPHPSGYDTERADDEQLVWIIAAVDVSTCELAAYALDKGAFRRVTIFDLLTD